jgi:hypothetical protein
MWIYPELGFGITVYNTFGDIIRKYACERSDDTGFFSFELGGVFEI